MGNEILSHIRAESVRRLLRPLVRLFLRGSGRIQEFYEISKEVFADVAEEELERAGKRVTLSKLSIVTGLQRRDLRRIHAEGNQARPQAKNPLGRIITQWAQDERFTTSAGKPRVLDFGSAESEFSQLVWTVSSDVSPGTVLAEMERIGAVERTARGAKLVSMVRRLNANPSEGFELMASGVASLIEAVEENVLEDQPIRNLHLQTEFGNIYEEDLVQIRKWLLAEGKAFHRRARDYLSQFDKDFKSRPGKAGARVTLGTFSLTKKP
ncbi:MAG: hypothetical protein KDD44_07475 [Bdellovibrionales bacterium]|nr:hypothetical protein [Bdellovibrionales bacterium]